MTTKCKVCPMPDCEVSVPPADVKIVVAGLRDRYGRSLRWSLRMLAAQIVHEVAEAGRLGDGPHHDDGWEPTYDDVDDFGGPLANYQGEMRLWRAEEIGHVGLLALGRAGRLLDRPAKTQPDELERRTAWREAISRLAVRQQPHPKPWQVDLAAALLSHRIEDRITGDVEVWSNAQRLASELVDEMKADGRLNKWGNWPEPAERSGAPSEESP